MTASFGYDQDDSRCESPLLPSWDVLIGTLARWVVRCCLPALLGLTVLVGSMHQCQQLCRVSSTRQQRGEQPGQGTAVHAWFVADSTPDRPPVHAACVVPCNSAMILDVFLRLPRWTTPQVMSMIHARPSDLWHVAPPIPPPILSIPVHA